MQTMSENINLSKSSESGQTMSGNIHVSGCTGSYNTMSGNITCYDSKCKKLKTMSGNIECNISKIGHIETMSGNIDLINSVCDDIETMSGDILLKDLSTDKVSCMSSKITLNNANIKTLYVTGTKTGIKMQKPKKLFGIFPIYINQTCNCNNSIMINNVCYDNFPSIYVMGSCTIENIICDADEPITIEVTKMGNSGLRNDKIENGTLKFVN